MSEDSAPKAQTPVPKRIQSDPLRQLSRRQSSPSHLLIRDADLLLKVQQTLPSVNSTPLRLENRRKYAPLTPAGHDRPKFLAGGCGIFSVEPTIRKTLSQGSLVKGVNISLDIDDNKLPPVKTKQMNNATIMATNVKPISASTNSLIGRQDRKELTDANPEAPTSSDDKKANSKMATQVETHHVEEIPIDITDIKQSSKGKQKTKSSRDPSPDKGDSISDLPKKPQKKAQSKKPESKEEKPRGPGSKKTRDTSPKKKDDPPESKLKKSQKKPQSNKKSELDLDNQGSSSAKKGKISRDPSPNKQAIQKKSQKPKKKSELEIDDTDKIQSKKKTQSKNAEESKGSLKKPSSKQRRKSKANIEKSEPKQSEQLDEDDLIDRDEDELQINDLQDDFQDPFESGIGTQESTIIPDNENHSDEPVIKEGDESGDEQSDIAKNLMANLKEMKKGADWMKNQLEEKRASKSKQKASASEEQIESTVMKAFAKSMAEDEEETTPPTDRKMATVTKPGELDEGD